MWGRPDLEGFDKTAGQFFDELKQRKKLQNPETQAFLHYLERNGYITDFSEKWTPWLLNQVKGGRVTFYPNRNTTALWFKNGERERRLGPECWQHWTDWLNSGHGTRQRAGNPEHLSPGDIEQHVAAWEEDLANKATERHRGAGTPVHQFDDGWSIRELAPDEVRDEGNAMGHCVGSYASHVRDGNLRVLSLRDPKGDPHVTTGIYYNQGRDIDGDNGYIYQHYGKNNQTPKDEYNQRFKEYFSTIPMAQRPLAEEPNEDNYIYDHDDLGKWLEANHPAWKEDKGPDTRLSELGLPYERQDGTTAPPDFDIDSLHDGLVYQPWGGRYKHFDYQRAENLYRLLKDHGNISEYEKEVLGPAEEKIYDGFDNHFYMDSPPYSVTHYEQFPNWHPDGWDDEEWAEWLAKTKQQDTPENRQKVTEDYEESEARDRDEALGEWPEWQAAHAMREFIQPHYNPEINAYQQQPYKPNVKQANTFHYHPTFGHPCLCPWGGGERNLEFVGSVKVADKVDWLRGRKDMQDPEALSFLDELVDKEYPDKLLPWIIREWRKGRLGFKNRWGNTTFHLMDQADGGFSFLTPVMAKQWVSYADEMKKYKKGIDFMQHTYPELRQAMNEAHDFLTEKKRPNMGEVLHRFDDGWTVRRLQDAMEARVEGDDMGHCVGSYGQNIENGDTHILSLRDPNNKPHGTLELDPGQWERDGLSEKETPLIAGSTVVQWYGHSNNTPKAEYTEKMNEYLRNAGVEEIEPEEDHKWWEDEYQGYDIETPDEYVNHRSGGEEYAPEEYHQACADAFEHDLEEPDLLPGETKWDDIVHELMTKPNIWTHDAEDVFDAAKEHGELNHVYDAWKEWHELNPGEGEEYYPEANRVFKDEMAQHINPENGMFSHPRHFFDPNAPGGYSWETALDRWWDSQKENYPQLPGADWGGQPMPEWARPAISAKIAASVEPLYYRWSLSPDTGHVEISHNHGKHPAEVDYHRDLAGKINRPNLVHGYAYRIPGGFRLTDWEHQPVKDPFITAQITRALSQPQPGDDWQNAEPDFDKLHYGLPG